jgi:hypothetical protein
MKIKLSTAYGSQEKYDIEVMKVNLDTTNLDEKEALENGWLLYDGRWYLSRSTRIDLSVMRSVLPSIAGIKFQVESS